MHLFTMPVHADDDYVQITFCHICKQALQVKLMIVAPTSFDKACICTIYLLKIKPRKANDHLNWS